MAKKPLRASLHTGRRSRPSSPTIEELTGRPRRELAKDETWMARRPGIKTAEEAGRAWQLINEAECKQLSLRLVVKSVREEEDGFVVRYGFEMV